LAHRVKAASTVAISNARAIVKGPRPASAADVQARVAAAIDQDKAAAPSADASLSPQSSVFSPSVQFA